LRVDNTFATACASVRVTLEKIQLRKKKEKKAKGNSKRS
jgi:hypothetical protein